MPRVSASVDPAPAAAPAPVRWAAMADLSVRHDGRVTRVAGVMLNEESEVAIGLPCEVVYEETKDPKIVMPRWKINGSAANTWRFVE